MKSAYARPASEHSPGESPVRAPSTQKRVPVSPAHHRGRRPATVPVSLLTNLRLSPAGAEHREYLTTSDDLLVRWECEGADDEAVLVLRDTSSGAMHSVRTRTKAGSCLIRATDLRRIRAPIDWRSASASRSYEYQLELSTSSRVFRAGPFETRPVISVKIRVGTGGQATAEVSTPDAGGVIPHACTVRLLAKQKRAPLRPRMQDQELEIAVVDGRGEAAFPQRFVPDIASLHYRYLGDHPEELIRMSVVG